MIMITSKSTTSAHNIDLLQVARFFVPIDRLQKGIIKSRAESIHVSGVCLRAKR